MPPKVCETGEGDSGDEAGAGGVGESAVQPEGGAARAETAGGGDEVEGERGRCRGRETDCLPARRDTSQGLCRGNTSRLLNSVSAVKESTTSPLRLREWLATGSRLCMYKDGHCVHFLLWTVGLWLGSQYVALARCAMPRCRVARIDSISIFAAGRDVGRRDGAMRHIVNVALVSSHVLPCKCYHYCHIVLIVLFCVYKCLLDITISFSPLSSPSLLPLPMLYRYKT